MKYKSRHSLQTSLSTAKSRAAENEEYKYVHIKKTFWCVKLKYARIITINPFLTEKVNVGVHVWIECKVTSCFSVQNSFEYASRAPTFNDTGFSLIWLLM